jgi:universal stress protein A
MPNLSRILVPVDFTKRTNPAFEYAVFVAERHNADIDVLHVWEPPRYVVERDVKISVGGKTRESLKDVIKREASKELDAFLEQHKHPTLKVSGRLECGLPSETILNVAGEGDYSLIVIGTKGRSGLAHFIVGSVAENVVRNAPCPVLTIRIGD